MRPPTSRPRAELGRQFGESGLEGLDSPTVVAPVEAEQSESGQIGPIRTCIGCRERHPKRELLRLVTRFDADLSQWVVAPDLQASAPGRGAHLHPTQECLELAKRRRAFDRALRHDAQVRGGPLSLAVLDQYFAH